MKKTKLKALLKIKLIVLFVFLIIASVNAATIKGTVYEWYSLNDLNNVIIEINSKPIQRMVSFNGNYEFNVADGNYEINAFYFDENTLKYKTQEKIEVKGKGIFNLDLIMFPVLEDLNDTTEFDENILKDNTIENSLKGNNKGINLGNNEEVILLLLVFAIALIIIFFFMKKQLKKIEEKTKQENSLENKKLDSYALQVIQLLKKYSNRMTQKELREKMDLSEAKISLIVADLESQKIIKKIKKGRGNIIILIEKN